MVTLLYAMLFSPPAARRPTKPITQQVVYEDRAAVDAALAKLSKLPPLVTPTEICRLKDRLREVALGKAFLLQGGDCAELFDYCEETAIDSKIKLLLQMSLVLIWGANKPVVRIARMAGQFAKPRSSATEVVNGQTIPSFRGDNINGYDAAERTPDPARLVSAYFHSATTLNYVRAQLGSGMADLHSPLDWNLGHVPSAPIKAQYQRIVHSITDSLRFMQTVGAEDAAGRLQTVELYMSHEGLLLEYEQSLTRRLKHPLPSARRRRRDAPPPPAASSHPAAASAAADTDDDEHGWYNTSAHFLWIGDRTRALSGAHVEYFRGIHNPIGIKVGPSTDPTELVQLLDALDPHHEPGKITLITRYGAQRVDSLLPRHLAAVQASAHTVVWQCDPMHGNTVSTSTGGSPTRPALKTRHFSSILAELARTFHLHAAHGSHLGGVHLELTGEAVTECLGGNDDASPCTEDQLASRYRTFCDPRLNEKQALEVAFLLGGWLRGEGHALEGQEQILPPKLVDA
ncbi:MAG: hypothetical protein M1826_000076 [Phylliscum demangeonii]|nr:MAG: hypothetical protein M1826_000076 [Phylliscum demangeonii]